MLQVPKKVFNFVAVAVGFVLQFGRFQQIGAVRNDGFDVLLRTIGTSFVTITGLVSQHFARIQAF